MNRVTKRKESTLLVRGVGGGDTAGRGGGIGGRRNPGQLTLCKSIPGKKDSRLKKFHCATVENYNFAICSVPFLSLAGLSTPAFYLCGRAKVPETGHLGPGRETTPLPFLYPLATPFMVVVEWLFVNCNLAIGPPRASPQEREEEEGVDVWL